MHQDSPHTSFSSVSNPCTIVMRDSCQSLVLSPKTSAISIQFECQRTTAQAAVHGDRRLILWVERGDGEQMEE